jgi:hypothetical protein
VRWLLGFFFFLVLLIIFLIKNVARPVAIFFFLFINFLLLRAGFSVVAWSLGCEIGPVPNIFMWPPPPRGWALCYVSYGSSCSFAHGLCVVLC